MKKLAIFMVLILVLLQGGNHMALRTKLLTNSTYSPTDAASEAAIRAQIDAAVQEALDLALADTTARGLSSTGNFTGLINGGSPALTEPGLSAAFDAHLLEKAAAGTLGHVKVDGSTISIDTDGIIHGIAAKCGAPNKTMKKLIDNLPVKVVCVGDSITWGYNTGPVQSAAAYPTVLQTKMRYLWGYNDVTVANGGLSGATVAIGLEYFDTNVLAESPDLCVIMFGLNDNGSSDVSLVTYTENLRTYIKLCKANNIEVILMSPTPSIDRVSTDLGNDYNLTLVDYAKACESLAIEQGVDYIDMHTEVTKLWQTNGIKKSFYDGTLHFYDYTIIADILMKERLADKYTSEFDDMDFISFSSPYAYNSTTTVSDISSTLLKQYYSIDNSKPTESIKFAVYNDTPNATLNFYILKTPTAGNVVLTNWGTDFATIDGADTETANDWIETVTMTTVGLYFFELKASKVDTGKIFYTSGLHIQKENLLTSIDLSLQNGWTWIGSTFQTAKAYKDNKVVHLAGTIGSGTTTNTTLIATLPVNYRPKADLIIKVASCSGTTLQVGALKIATNGQITCFIGIANTYLLLDGITFVTQ